MSMIISPANYLLFGFFPTVIISFLLPVIGVVLFTYIMARRIAPMVRANPDYRFSKIPVRIKNLIVVWLGQIRQPRYMQAGVLHIVIFAGFLILSIRSISLVIMGVFPGYVFPGLDGTLGAVYNFIKDYAATAVLAACILAAWRRGIKKPARYAVPEKYGHDHTVEAVFVLGIISTLMISESMFEAAAVAYNYNSLGEAHFPAFFSLAWFFAKPLRMASLEFLQGLHIFMYYVHDFTFFFFLCFLPMGKHFHVITSIFNVFFMRVKDCALNRCLDCGVRGACKLT